MIGKALDRIKSAGAIATKAEKKVQDKTDEAIKGIDSIGAQKEKEIMEV